MTLTLLPTAEKALIAFIENDADLGAQVGGPGAAARVATKLSPILPAWRITLVGGTPDDPWCGRPSLQCEAWAADQQTASDMMRALIAALPRVRGLETDGGVVHTYEVTSGPFWSPDDPALSSNARYIATVDLLTTPTT